MTAYLNRQGPPQELQINVSNRSAINGQQYYMFVCIFRMACTIE